MAQYALIEATSNQVNQFGGYTRHDSPRISAPTCRPSRARADAAARARCCSAAITWGRTAGAPSPPQVAMAALRAAGRGLRRRRFPQDPPGLLDGCADDPAVLADAGDCRAAPRGCARLAEATWRAVRRRGAGVRDRHGSAHAGRRDRGTRHALAVTSPTAVDATPSPPIAAACCGAGPGRRPGSA